MDENYKTCVINTKGLTKTFRAKTKSEGLAASFKALVKPEWRTVEAVRGIDLNVGRGEIIAFIGPNGAGKSTFIKMLCGILHPTDGEISVLGISPQRERRRLAMKIGAVFGQKSQLWLHLPAADSFTLLAAIYEISDGERKRRVGELTELFDLGEFIHTPVRKLSLGQRVRCEVAASLLHNPEILFLDEPTIGLDVVVKHAIRELIVKRNREQGTTVFLTSHDPGDIEQLCRRAAVIDHGVILLDQSVEKMRADYLGKKLIDVTFGIAQTLPELTGVTVMSRDGINVEKAVSPGCIADGAHGGSPPGALRWTLSVDTAARPIGEVMNRLSALGNVLDITINDPPMEEIITAIFEHRQTYDKKREGFYETES
jgi:ABC-2 type transport system ATP-binding protein